MEEFSNKSDEWWRVDLIFTLCSYVTRPSGRKRVEWRMEEVALMTDTDGDKACN